jgi:hypothetical protein
MKLLLISLIFIPVLLYAEDDCIFDESTYIEFINKYSADNRNSKTGPDNRTLLINRNNEEILIKGSGCNHLGMTIELSTQQAYTEEQFLQKALDLSIEFGNWLINTKALKDAIAKGDHEKIEGTYYVKVDAMTVFSASHDKQGRIHVDFYIN